MRKIFAGSASIIFKILAILLLSGCATPNVFFFEKIAQPNIHEPRKGTKVVSVHIDAHGSLYPDSGYPARFEPTKKDVGSLQNMSIQKSKDETWVYDRLCLASTTGQAAKLCKNALEGTWKSAQSTLWQEKASQILDSFSTNSKDRTLVFLIHGFNVPAGGESGSFAIARERIKRLTTSETEIVYVEVNWDGFALRPGNRAWSSAQSSGPLVGFKMRELFNSISAQSKTKNLPEPKIRILGHSSAAFIVGAAFGNPIGALPNLQKANPNKDPGYWDFYQERTAVPHIDDLRIGIAAAATSSLTYAGFQKPCKLDAEKCKEMGLLTRGSTLVLTLNPYDMVLIKKFGIENLSLAGATGVGASKSTFCEVETSDRLAKSNINVIGLDFIRDTELKDYKKSHSFSVYLTQEQSADFLQILMGEKEVSDHEIKDCFTE